MLFKLFSETPFTTITFSMSTGRLRSGTGMAVFPVRYRPVTDRVSPFIRAGWSANSSCPPRLPAPGPRSMILSDLRIRSGSCSTMTAVLPWFTRFLITFESRSVSLGCSPTLGSSRTKSVETSRDPRALVRSTRSTSPPDKVRDALSSVR